MGAAFNANGTTQKTGKNKFPTGKFRKSIHNRVFNGNHPPSLLAMRSRLPLPPGHLPPPRMGPMRPPAPGMRPPLPYRGGPQLRPPLPPPHMIRGLRPHAPPLPGMRPPLPPPLGMRPIFGMNIRPHMHPPILPPMRDFGSPMNIRKQGNKNRYIKRKRIRFARTKELNQPWVTEQVKAEFAKKDELLKIAKNTLQPTDWATYRGQRDKCNEIYAAAKLEYIGQHPEEGLTMTDENICNSSEEEEDLDYNTTNCEMCDREFQTNFQYRKHMSEHKICGIDNCPFTAHEKIVEKHIEMQHCTGLYDKIKSVVTPEDIAKWIADRKKKYPTKQNIERRYQQQKEMLERGERLKRNPRKFDHKNKTRFTLPQKPQTKKIIKKRKVAAPSTSLIQDKSDWNGNLCPFGGTSQLYQQDVVQEVEDFDDSEWVQNASVPETSLNNALGSLMSAYNSETDDEAPIEQKISKTSEFPTPAVSQLDNKTTPKRKRKRVTRKKKPNSKKAKVSGTNQEDLSHVPDRPIPVYRKRRVTLLERLLANEIVNERNVLLQCVRYVVANNFFVKKNCENASEAGDN
ncbi:hypothetical protein RN001_007185 [Aquatica leii]|uniref:C2H2-type domain-containing protein n=1 Tax=Aquatica leii TaxID=1421715 RepID=A0AAN7P8D3_9COLE|nr:hypothetical protein RN001_007185 [Aquatica leii]